jgi:hypothetical protein
MFVRNPFPSRETSKAFDLVVTSFSPEILGTLRDQFFSFIDYHQFLERQGMAIMLWLLSAIAQTAHILQGN